MPLLGISIHFFLETSYRRDVGPTLAFLSHRPSISSNAGKLASTHNGWTAWLQNMAIG